MIKNLGRAKMYILDFDWLFEHGNANKFIEMLCESDSQTIFAQKSIQTAIYLFWDEMKHCIIRHILLPNILFGIFFILINQYVDTNFELEYVSNFQNIFLLKMIVLLIFSFYEVVTLIMRKTCDTEFYLFCFIFVLTSGA